MSARVIDWTERLSAERKLREAVAVLAANPNPMPADIRISQKDNRTLCGRSKPLAEMDLDRAARLLIDYLIGERERLRTRVEKSVRVRARLRAVPEVQQ